MGAPQKPTRRLKDMTSRRSATTAQQPVTPGAGAAPGLKGQLPLPAGELLTDLERRVLEADKPGEGLPPELLKQLSRQARADADEVRLPPGVSEDHQAVILSEADITDLDPAHQAEIRSLIDIARDSIKKATAKKPPVMTASKVAGMGQAMAAIQKAEETPPEEEPAPVEEFPGGTDMRPTHCQHCGWPLDKDDPIEITEENRLAHEAAFLSGDRYVQELSLLHGKFKIVFRGLTVEECDLAYRQTVLDVQKGAASKNTQNEPDLWGTLMSYRLAMSLASIETPLQGKIIIDPIGDMELEEPLYPNTKLIEYHGLVMKRVLPTESLRKVVGDAFHKWSGLVEKLDAQVGSDSFREGAGGQA